MSSDYSEAEAIVVALVRELVRTADPSTLKRICTGEIVPTLAERDEIAALIDGLSIEAAYAALNGYSTKGSDLKKYFGPPSVVSSKAAPAGSAKPAIIAAILQDAYGQTYTPPKPAKAARPTAATKTPRQATPRKVKQPFDASTVAAELQAATSESDAQGAIARIGSKPNHQAVARLLGVEYRSKDTVTDLQEAILRQVVTRRLEHDAYMRRAQAASH